MLIIAEYIGESLIMSLITIRLDFYCYSQIVIKGGGYHNAVVFFRKSASLHVFASMLSTGNFHY